MRHPRGRMTLTRGEMLWLLRRRMEMTMPAMARHLKISEDRLRNIEKDRESFSDWYPLIADTRFAPAILIGDITPLRAYEVVQLMRRRSGWSLKYVAEQLQKSRPYINHGEFGRWAHATQALLDWWDAMGWRKPQPPCRDRLDRASEKVFAPLDIWYTTLTTPLP